MLAAGAGAGSACRVSPPMTCRSSVTCGFSVVSRRCHYDQSQTRGIALHSALTANEACMCVATKQPTILLEWQSLTARIQLTLTGLQ